MPRCSHSSKSADGSNITVYFPTADKAVGYVLSHAIPEKSVFVDDAAYMDGLQNYKQVMKSEKTIKDLLTIREKEFEPYAGFLG